MKNCWMVGLVAGTLAVGAGCVMNNPGNGNDPEAVEVRVATGFAGATRIKSTTGVEETTVCDGWYPATANHMLYVDASLGMTIRVSSTEAVPQLWILCGQSNFCGEQVDGNTAEFSRFWTTGGPCEVYVGTETEGAMLNYTLEFFESE